MYKKRDEVALSLSPEHTYTTSFPSSSLSSLQRPFSALLKDSTPPGTLARRGMKEYTHVHMIVTEKDRRRGNV